MAGYIASSIGSRPVVSAAETGVTEMKTPTSNDDLPAVRGRGEVWLDMSGTAALAIPMDDQ
ncbi:hypothetical protein ABZY19_22090 [Streptomyces sp. NPDC006475]|uniref:hypothetical protein n=1 Tax=Streptomyces sp. NPDC006475 TaxID=3155719 RepID=UPI0033A7FBF6